MSKPTPVHYLLPIYPGFQLLDVAGPLDILNLLSLTQLSGKSITLTFIASTLDPVPTKPIASIDPTTNKPKWSFSDWAGLDSPTPNLSFNQHLVPDVTFDSYLSALQAGTIDASPESKHKPVDVLLIPGGIGTRVTRTDATTGKSASNVADLIDFLPKIAPRVRHSIVTVCTGSDVLAQAGLLTDRRATSNMTRFDTVAARSPAVKWQKARRYVRSLPGEAESVQNNNTTTNNNLDGCNADGITGGPFQGEIWTSAGISAGMDVTLAFVAEYYGGVEVSRDLATKLEYEWREIPEGAIDPLYGLKEEDIDRK